mgnify:CR=1 FL=1
MTADRHVVLTLELTRGEQATLARALQVYAAKYQELVGRERDQGFKQDLRNYVARADELLRRVRPELQHGPMNDQATKEPG